MNSVNPQMNTAELKTNKKNPSEKVSDGCRSIKLYESTLSALEKLSEQINGSGPKRVQFRDMLEVAVQKISMTDLKKIREQKLTATDRFEEMFESFKVKNPKAGREMFLEDLMKNISASPMSNPTSLKMEVK